MKPMLCGNNNKCGKAIPIEGGLVTREDTNHKLLQIELEHAQQYCEQANGMSHCKNCGLDFEALLKLLKASTTA